MGRWSPRRLLGGCEQPLNQNSRTAANRPAMHYDRGVTLIGMPFRDSRNIWPAGCGSKPSAS